MKKNIALIAGGYSGEYVISIKTAVTIENNINKEKYNVYKIILDKNEWAYTDKDGKIYEVNRKDFSLSINSQTIKFDCVYIAVHGTPGEDGKLQGYLEMLDIPFTSCSAIVSGLTFNKIYCNAVVAQSKAAFVSKSLHVVKSRRIENDEILSKIKLPVFIKPAEGGSSLATTKVKTVDEIQPALDAVFAIETQAMIEEFVKGRELSIGVYRVKNQLYALPTTEIISTKEFFDYEAKYTPGITNEVTPAQIDNATTEKVNAAAKKIYDILNCKGICRIDFILEESTQNLYFLEINTIPGQSENSIVPQQIRCSGNTLAQFYEDLIEDAINSHK
ncbi:MAG TPA: D-alanine--D-alanine ligase [Chitinophagaceae bacterium]|nr:MAG: D-alanyl-alanine synthetase A [Bacteroidetes bacterium OLB11]HMN33072.1 D-alanine--D-alanine ligase [Chitinophagaceae bacterium]